MKATQLLSATLPVLSAADTGAHALQMMNDFHVQHLPVVDAGHLLGLISEEMILNHHNSSENIMVYDLSGTQKVALESEHIFEVLKTVHENKLTVIPVLDHEHKYVGAITRYALLDYFAKETDITEAGGIIVIDMQEKEFLLSEIARIVEQNSARIIGAFLGTEKETGRVLLTLKLNVENLQPVIQSLERFNYTIVDSYQEPEYLDNLKDRFDSLMNYLNV